ncbi:protein-L-isoaspartate O-methyltransferase [Roseobacter denitrificans]|uniref:Protein-L-isoaspartate O-methyltransferase n=1 Tax=Roseobacter denitrificans (strain ATCC 33942 / OCh 114) TaxID=375451 RepID=Q169I1_ROSDO|nr:protein-L-isoaspartate O-methyltransferase [Roseobacter denitrificans]ABG31362.1 protein-L-isoaspartate O-methyltransferase, putative [Roseobacter denitrificans OCh 114]AVL54386.1 protein-L-isoaspartate O-methyltransferase [Roseobacter denitrificans]SFG00045.1 protein-L-isoaspartate(D-aspartate) O-methyltransferase [Roseobacter denitrificans OCh 114]
MADFLSRRTMMVDTQVRPSDVTKFPIIDAMLTIPREEFVPAAQREAAYLGENLPIGGHRVILEPRTLAKMLDALDVSVDELVLDVGSALGYSAAVIARMAEAVVAVEEDEALASEAQEALSAAGVDNVILHVAPLAEGAAQHGPYDVMLVQGGVVEFPQTLADQLNEGGRVACIFMVGALGEVRIGRKQNGKISWRMAFNAGAPVLPGFEKAAAFQF